ncbi:DNA cytosine methyltransferase [Streptacidiphilus cavernicola]|uniref:DNA cytosine methyltransferase n=1 Tax=Streptacidiphilus cavernicola TaxID=3342716 RepID=A0ABV6VNU3_9ACTN
MELTFNDMLAGAGGSSSGLVEAGWTGRLALNHWDVAMLTHGANHPNMEHLTADITGYPMRYLPRAMLLWASVICTELSYAGGNRQERDPFQMDLLDLLDPDEADEWKALTPEAFEATRATAWCVVRACEAQAFPYVVVENVNQFVTSWVLYDTWCKAMMALGYERPQVLSVTSAHIWDENNPGAPQWRDRVYVVWRRKGMPKPDLEPRPLAFCFDCGKDVRARKAWRDPRVRVGKYGEAYDYRCPSTRCRHTLVEPYVRPAASVIDWSDIGTRIGDRKTPLADTTMERIAAGRAKFPYQPSAVTLNHGREGGDRAFAVGEQPFTVRTVKQGEALLVPTGGSWSTDATDVSEPMRTRLTRESEGLLTVSPDPQPYIVTYRNHAAPAPATDPLSMVTAQGNHHGLVTPGRPVPAELRNALVIPYRKSLVKSAGAPFHTMSTVDSAALLANAPAVEDCYFRMIQPEEQFAAQRFTDTYISFGTKAQRTKQAGNAVSVNVARHIGERIAAVL